MMWPHLPFIQDDGVLLGQLEPGNIPHFKWLSVDRTIVSSNCKDKNQFIFFPQ